MYWGYSVLVCRSCPLHWLFVGSSWPSSITPGNCQCSTWITLCLAASQQLPDISFTSHPHFCHWLYHARF
jgi:hypothetical protein